MRDRVQIKLGGEELALLPAFSVVDGFESRFGGLLDYWAILNDGKAPLEIRAHLLLLGLKAEDPSRNWTVEAVKKGMYEVGLWHEDLVLKESEFVERLIYTPEQYLAKKEQREQAEAALQEALQSSSE